MQPRSHPSQPLTLHAEECLPRRPPEARSTLSLPWLAHAARQHLCPMIFLHLVLQSSLVTAAPRLKMPYNASHAKWSSLVAQAMHEYRLCL